MGLCQNVLGRSPFFCGQTRLKYLSLHPKSGNAKIHDIACQLDLKFLFFE